MADEFENQYRVYFIRNGHTDFRKSHQLTGWYDSFLSLQGIYEAHEASQELINSGNNIFDVVFTSNLSRARKFANIILEDLEMANITIYHSWRLNERHHGWHTGHKSIDSACKYGTQQSLYWYLSKNQIPRIDKSHEYHQSIVQTAKEYGVSDNRIPSYETIDLCAQRIQPYWDSFIGPMIRANKRILIIVHEHSFRGFIKIIQEIDVDEMMRIKLPSPSIPAYYDVNDDLVSTKDMTFICSNEKKQAWLRNRWVNPAHIPEEITLL